MRAASRRSMPRATFTSRVASPTVARRTTPARLAVAMRIEASISASIARRPGAGPRAMRRGGRRRLRASLRASSCARESRPGWQRSLPCGYRGRPCPPALPAGPHRRMPADDHAGPAGVTFSPMTFSPTLKPLVTSSIVMGDTPVGPAPFRRTGNGCRHQHRRPSHVPGHPAIHPRGDAGRVPFVSRPSTAAASAPTNPAGRSRPRHRRVPPRRQRPSDHVVRRRADRAAGFRETRRCVPAHRTDPRRLESDGEWGPRPLVRRRAGLDRPPGRRRRAPRRR